MITKFKSIFPTQLDLMQIILCSTVQYLSLFYLFPLIAMKVNFMSVMFSLLEQNLMILMH